MQIRNNNDLDLAGDDREQITVRVVPKKPGDTVAYALDGTKGVFPNPLTFKLDQATNDPSVLTLVFTFLGSDGGFEITVTGSNGGPSSFYSYEQLGVAVGSISYTIDVL